MFGHQTLHKCFDKWKLYCLNEYADAATVLYVQNIYICILYMLTYYIQLMILRVQFSAMYLNMKWKCMQFNFSLHSIPSEYRPNGYEWNERKELMIIHKMYRDRERVGERKEKNNEKISSTCDSVKLIEWWATICTKYDAFYEQMNFIRLNLSEFYFVEKIACKCVCVRLGKCQRIIDLFYACVIPS